MQPLDIEETFVAPDPEPIFQKAMVHGVLSIRDVLDEVYMYMYSTDNRHYFKHRDTREYTSVSR